jgi:hypothetical protein
MKPFLFVKPSLLWLVVILILDMACSKDSTEKVAPASFNYPNFQNNQGLNILQDASLDQKKLMLNTYASYGISGCWYGRSKVSVAQGFETTFQLKLYNDNDFYAVEGLAFVIQNAGADSLGKRQYGKGNLGYDGLANSLAIEFDTQLSKEQGDVFLPPYYGHISVHTKGKEPNSANENSALGQPTPLPVNLLNGNIHTIKISYTPGTMVVFIDNTSVKAITVNLEEKLKLDQGTAFIGFTASPLSYFEREDIMSWSFSPTNAK